MVEFEDADLSGSTFRNVDLSGAVVRSAFMNDVAVVDAWVSGMRIEGTVVSLEVNGVDVASYVEAELDRRHPERLDLRRRDLDGLRIAWAAAHERWAPLVDRVRALGPDAADERVNDEFSFSQTLRHLVFAADRWLTGPVFGDPAPYFHPIGRTHASAVEGEVDGLDPDAHPSLDEVLEVRAAGFRRVGEFLTTSTPADLVRVVPSPNGGETTVAECIGVVLREEWWHHRYASRDLTLLEQRQAPG